MKKPEFFLKCIYPNKKLKSNDIVELYYLECKNDVDEKRLYYKEKGVEKTENELRYQISAEFTSIPHKNNFKYIQVENKEYFLTLEGIKYYEDNFLELDNEENIEIIVEQSNIKKLEKEIIYQMTSEELDWKCLTIYKYDNKLDFEISDSSIYSYIFDGKYNLVKIGKSSTENLFKRYNNLKTGNPAINIEIVFPSTYYSESFLKEKFKIYREEREWFHKTKDIVNFIEEHKRKNKLALEFYNKQKEIKNIENQILNW